MEDLLGLKVVTSKGDAFGTVQNIENFGAGDLVEIRPIKGPTVFVPFTKDAVPHLDFNAKQITIDLEIAGLDGKDEEVKGDVG